MPLPALGGEIGLLRARRDAIARRVVSQTQLGLSSVVMHDIGILRARRDAVVRFLSSSEGERGAMPSFVFLLLPRAGEVRCLASLPGRSESEA